MIRAATADDLPQINKIYEYARSSSFYGDRVKAIQQFHISQESNLKIDKLYNTYFIHDYKTINGNTIIERFADNNKLSVNEFLIANKDINSENTLLYAGKEVVGNKMNTMPPIMPPVARNTSPILFILPLVKLLKVPAYNKILQ